MQERFSFPLDGSLEELEGELDSSGFTSNSAPIALPLPAWREAASGARRAALWRRRVGRCLVLGPLAAGGALLVGCFLMCPMLWLRLPPGAAFVSRVVILGAAGVSLWAGAAAVAFCYWRQRRQRWRRRRRQQGRRQTSASATAPRHRPRPLPPSTPPPTFTPTATAEIAATVLNVGSPECRTRDENS